MIRETEEIVDTLSPEEAKAFMKDHGFKQVSLEKKIRTPIIFVWPSSLRETIHPRALWQIKPNLAIVERVTKVEGAEHGAAYLQYNGGESYFSLIRVPIAPPTSIYIGGVALHQRDRTRRVLEGCCFTAHPEHIHCYFPRPFAKRKTRV